MLLPRLTRYQVNGPISSEKEDQDAKAIAEVEDDLTRVVGLVKSFDGVANADLAPEAGTVRMTAGLFVAKDARPTSLHYARGRRTPADAYWKQVGTVGVSLTFDPVRDQPIRLEISDPERFALVATFREGVLQRADDWRKAVGPGGRRTTFERLGNSVIVEVLDDRGV